MIRRLNIPTDQAIAGDVTPFANMFGNPDEDGEVIREIQGTIMITFDELEKADEPILLNSHVRSYFRKLHSAVPHMFYYLYPEPAAGAILAFVIAFSDDDRIGITGDQVYAKTDERVNETLINHLVKAGRFAAQKGDDWLTIIEAFGESLPSEIQQEVLVRLQDQLAS